MSRLTLKEERTKLKAETARHPVSRHKIILRDSDASDASLDSDDTLEIRFGGGQDFDSDISDEIVRFGTGFSDVEDSDINSDGSTAFPFRNLWEALNVDTDSSDEDFSVRRWNRNRAALFSDSSSSSSSSSDSSDPSDSSDTE
jgi:hypothetical protein